MSLALLVTKDILGLDIAKVEFKPSPQPETGVQHPPLAMMNKWCI